MADSERFVLPWLEPPRMPPLLPPEILDLIANCLHDDTSALKACCLVSKSWISRTRRHLFAQLTLSSRWVDAFPDPTNSPGHHTRTLRIHYKDDIIAASTVAPTLVRHFCNIEELRIVLEGRKRVSLVQLHGLSPTLKYLHLSYVPSPLSEVLDLICSFPLLEDLWLDISPIWRGGNERYFHFTSPKLTGSLHLRGQNCFAMRGLLDFPNGLRFAEIAASCSAEDAKLLVELIARCSDTLESLSVRYYSSASTRFSVPKPLILSEATKLKDAKFLCIGLNIQWITTTLRMAKSTNLRNIAITVTSGVSLVDPVGEAIRRDWQDLDHLLDHLWTSRSICSKIWYEEGWVVENFGELVLTLLPKFASKGFVNRVITTSEW